MDWLSSITAGVVSGVIASAIFFLALRLLRPKVAISGFVSVYPRDHSDEEILRIKVVNRRFRPVLDLKLTMFLEREVEVDGGYIMLRRTISSPQTITLWNQRRLFDKEYHNVRRIRVDQRKLIETLIEAPYCYLSVEISARDSVSGVTALSTQKYDLSAADSFRHGSFATGNSMKIVPYTGDKPFQFPDKLERARATSTRQEEQVSAPSEQ